MMIGVKTDIVKAPAYAAVVVTIDGTTVWTTIGLGYIRSRTINDSYTIDG